MDVRFRKRLSSAASQVEEIMNRVVKQFLAWFRRPATTGERIGAAFFGALGFFVVGAVARSAFGPRPVGFDELAVWGSGFSVVGIALGIRFPKAVICLMYPLMLVGGSAGS